jgi:hypothetical protein
MPAQAAQADPWEDAAKNFKPQASSGAPPSGSNEDWKLWQNAGTSAAPPENAVQRKFDELTTVTPEEDASTPSLLKPVAHFGAGAIQGAGLPFIHPLKTVQGLGSLVAHPADTVAGMLEGAKADPAKAMGNLVGGIDTAGAAAELGGGAMDLLPSKARAGETLQDIRSAASDVPVRPMNAWPEIERFQELTKRGGSTAKPVTQLSSRLQNMVRLPQQGDFTFPEARDFYSNISSQSAEDVSRLNPIMRRQMGAIRSGMHQDLTDAAGTIGRGDEYADAVKEYARAMQIRKAAGNAAKVGLGAAGLGVAGHYLRDMIPQR